MSEAVIGFSNIFVSLFPIFLLFLLCLTGFWFVNSNFKPKAVSTSEERRKGFANPNSHKKGMTAKRPLSAQELGIQDLKTSRLQSASLQKQNKLEKMVQTLSSQTPNQTASVLRSWLGDE